MSLGDAAHSEVVLEVTRPQHARTEPNIQPERASHGFLKIFTRLRPSARQYDSSSGTGQEEGGFPGVKTRQTLCRALARERAARSIHYQTYIVIVFGLLLALEQRSSKLAIAALNH